MAHPKSVLIIGASRGLGLALAQHYSSLGPKVYATVRADAKSARAKGEFPEDARIVGGIDMAKESVGRDLIRGLNEMGEEGGEGGEGVKIEEVYVVAGLLKTEVFGKASWKDQIDMYTICAVAPVIVVEALVTASLLAPKAKILLITSEAGSLTLRTAEEGGGNYGHHGSKAAGNMMGRMLSFDLKERGMAVVMIHPGFLKTEMTKSAGFEQYYDKMGAVSPDEAAEHLADFAKGLDMSMSGKLWAPMGGRGIGSAEAVLGKAAAEQTTPLELPW